MAVKLRLARRGRKQKPFYHIVAADARSPRDGKFIEKVGTYNPLTVPATIEVDFEKAFAWVMKGAEPTDTVNAILRFKGVLYKKHLQMGVNKGAISQEVADEKLAAWLGAKEEKVAARKQKVASEKAEFKTLVSGAPKAPAIIAATDEDRNAFAATEGGNEEE
ncbi:MAG TPA: 30S ribosomal protein S16 [Saprospiraceae bacterium]|nr:30S ribosomal protein S16 [Saprospiraceae bacterium]